jgi:uncharacterized protein HemX
VSDPFINGKQEPSTPTDNPIPAAHITPQVTTWRTGKLILVMLLIFGVGLVLSGGAAAIAIVINNSTNNKVDTRSKQRDKDTRRLIDRIDSQQRQIRALASKVAADQAKTTGVLCTAVITGLQQNKAKGTPDPNAARTVVFLRQYGCTVPPDLP